MSQTSSSGDSKRTWCSTTSSLKTPMLACSISGQLRSSPWICTNILGQSWVSATILRLLRDRHTVAWSGWEMWEAYLMRCFSSGHPWLHQSPPSLSKFKLRPNYYAKARTTETRSKTWKWKNNNKAVFLNSIAVSATVCLSLQIVRSMKDWQRECKTRLKRSSTSLSSFTDNVCRCWPFLPCFRHLRTCFCSVWAL